MFVSLCVVILFSSEFLKHLEQDGVTRVSHGRLKVFSRAKGVLKVFQGLFKIVSRLFHWCLKVGSKIFNGCFKEVSRAIKVCFKYDSMNL